MVSVIRPHSSVHSCASDAAATAAAGEASEQLQQLRQLEENRRRMVATAEAAAKKKAIARAVAEAREAGALKTERDRQIFWKSRAVDAKVRARLLLLLLLLLLLFLLLLLTCAHRASPSLYRASIAGTTARDAYGHGAA